MRLWRLSEPFDLRFARAGRVGGTWQHGEYKTRTRPILIEWERGSDLVGDFTWPGLDTDVIISDRVGVELQRANVRGFELRPVAMRGSLGARRSSSTNAYDGPQLWDLWVTAWASADRERSTVVEVTREDGSRSFEVVGVQRRERVWHSGRQQGLSVFHPRIDGKGIFIVRAQGLFRIEEFPSWIFCTDDVKQIIDRHGFTNVQFLEMGDVIGGPGER